MSRRRSRRVEPRGAAFAFVAVLGLLAAPLAAAGAPTHEATREELAALVRATALHPSLRAAAAAAEAARLRVDAVRSPVTLTMRYEHRRLVVEPPTDPLPPPLDELFAIDDRSDSFSLGATFRPFVVGDLRDLADSRLADLERSLLALREVRARIEAQAVRTAVSLLLAERGVALAASGLELARRSETATELRWETGSATGLDLRRARLAVDDAERALASALRQAAGAEDALERLAGAARLSAPPRLEPRLDVPPELVRAALDVAGAELALRAQGRALLPTVQAGYTWLYDDGGSLTLGLESRTLQPSLTYANDGGGQLAGGALTGLAPSGVTPTVRGAFSIGVSWTISLQATLEREAAAASLDAAAASLAAAHDRAGAERLALEATLAAAEAGVAFAELELQLARDELVASEARLEAGVLSPLDVEAARLALDRAAQALWGAQAERLGVVLDHYVAYAIPLSEVLP